MGWNGPCWGPGRSLEHGGHIRLFDTTVVCPPLGWTWKPRAGVRGRGKERGGREREEFFLFENSLDVSVRAMAVLFRPQPSSAGAGPRWLGAPAASPSLRPGPRPSLG